MRMKVKNFDFESGIFLKVNYVIYHVMNHYCDRLKKCCFCFQSNAIQQKD